MSQNVGSYHYSLRNNPEEQFSNGWMVDLQYCLSLTSYYTGQPVHYATPTPTVAYDPVVRKQSLVHNLAIHTYI
jgi:hypothetical protein